MKNGEGKFTYSDDSTYNGLWVENKKQGYGVAIESNGDKYAGYWLDDMKEENGTFTYADKSTYTGNWKQNKK